MLRSAHAAMAIAAMASTINIGPAEYVMSDFGRPRHRAYVPKPKKRKYKGSRAAKKASRP